MDRKSKNLFDVVGRGDELALQKLLLEDKVERNIATLAHGNTVLHEAAWNGFSRCVKILCNMYPKDQDENSKEKLEWKKSHFINRVNFCGFSALHLAAQNGHNQTLRELLYAGCQTDIQNDYGDSCLHSACRYGHAGVVRILISAKCDVDSFNLNHDTPLHISCCMGRRKLTKLLLEADAMQFPNLQNETPLDIAKRKKITEIVDIMRHHKEKVEKTIAARASKSPDNQPHLLPHNSKQKYNNNGQQNPLHWSPYGCHYYPDTRNFPSPKLESLPKEKLEKFEQYYLDLGGNIRKGPVGKGNKCNCAPFDKSSAGSPCRSAQKHVEEANERLDVKINELVSKIEKTVKENRRSRRGRSSERNLDPLYPLLRIVGDKNKQIHLENWLHKIHPADSNSDQNRSSFKEVSVDFHKFKERENVSKSPEKSSQRMPRYDENRNNESELVNEDEDGDDDENYTDISNESEGDPVQDSIGSNNENYLYDDRFLRNFQNQQINQNRLTNDDSLTSPSINSNQNIENEMEKIANSLLLDSDGVIVNRNPDVIRDHIHHSAKRSLKKIKSAITKPTTLAASNVLASGELYVNSFFNSDPQYGTTDEVDCISSSTPISNRNETASNEFRQSFHETQGWNQTGRSRNPLPVNIDEIEKFTDSVFTSDDATALSKNNFILLDQLLKARKKFNHSYQQQLESMHNSSTIKNKNEKVNQPSSSTLV